MDILLVKIYTEYKEHGNIFIQSDSKICKIVFLKNKNKKQTRNTTDFIVFKNVLKTNKNMSP